MQISPISNNNTNFKAQFMYDKGIYKELLENQAYRNDISEKTLELAKQLTKIGRGQKLEILKVDDETECDYHRTFILNHYNNHTHIFWHPKSEPFWDALLDMIVKTEKLFTLNNNVQRFHNLVAGKDD